MPQTPSAELAWARLAAVAAALVIAAHGLAHLMGVAFVVRAGKSPVRRCHSAACGLCRLSARHASGKQPGRGWRRDEMSPVVIEAEVDIERPPEEVFDYCSDHRHEPEWNPMMKRITKLTDGPVGAGTRYRAEFVKGPPMVMECTQYQRPTMWSLVGDSRVLKATGGWRVLPTASGARLVTRVEMELHGPLKLVAPRLRRREQPMFERDLHNIKARLEAARPAPGSGPEED
jgi:uncharacterized protein YndB with AHSA1/START domain